MSNFEFLDLDPEISGADHFTIFARLVLAVRQRDIQEAELTAWSDNGSEGLGPVVADYEKIAQTELLREGYPKELVTSLLDKAYELIDDMVEVGEIKAL